MLAWAVVESCYCLAAALTDGNFGVAGLTMAATGIWSVLLVVVSVDDYHHHRLFYFVCVATAQGNCFPVAAQTATSALLHRYVDPHHSVSA